MAITGLGQDGYIRVQKETTYGQEITNDMIFIPAKAGSSFSTQIQDIENTNIIASRLKQLPNKGREINKFEIQIDLYPDQIGLLMNLFLGTSTDASGGSGTYLHTWTLPKTGLTTGASFTMDVAKGGDTATRLTGCVINNFKINMSNQNNANVSLTLTGVAQGHTDGITRATVFTYPTSTPLNFGMALLKITPDGVSQFTQKCNSMEIEIDLGYNIEDFKTGSTKIVQPQYNTIPQLMLKANIDADKQFTDGANAHTLYKLDVVIESIAYAGGTVTYKTEIEIPKAKLNPETTIPYENDRLTMDLDFDGGFGGVTTGSPSSAVMGEVRVRDAEATYA